MSDAIPIRRLPPPVMDDSLLAHVMWPLPSGPQFHNDLAVALTMTSDDGIVRVFYDSEGALLGFCHPHMDDGALVLGLTPIHPSLDIRR